MINKIKTGYSKLFVKHRFITIVAHEIGRNEVYLRGHWFSGFWNIPPEHQEKVLELLENYLNTQEHI